MLTSKLRTINKKKINVSMKMSCIFLDIFCMKENVYFGKKESKMINI